MNVRRLACLFLLQLVMIASTFCGNLFAQLDPLNPPPVATHPDTPGRWVLDTVGPVGGQSGDLRGYVYPDDDPKGPVFATWLKSQGWLPWDRVYYLRTKIISSYNQLEAGTVMLVDTDRDSGVLGAFKVSVSKYGEPTQTFSYAKTVGHPPQPGSLGILQTDQYWWVTLKAKIPSMYYDYYSGTYYPSGYYYEWETSVSPITPVSKWYYRYQP